METPPLIPVDKGRDNNVVITSCFHWDHRKRESTGDQWDSPQKALYGPLRFSFFLNWPSCWTNRQVNSDFRTLDYQANVRWQATFGKLGHRWFEQWLVAYPGGASAQQNRWWCTLFWTFKGEHASIKLESKYNDCHSMKSISNLAPGIESVIHDMLRNWPELIINHFRPPRPKLQSVFVHWMWSCRCQLLWGPFTLSGVFHRTQSRIIGW